MTARVIGMFKSFGMLSATAEVSSIEDPRARLKHFGDELDALKQRTISRLGDEDVAYITRLDRFSRALEITGRALIHVSFEPATFLLGVLALATHKQLQTAEIGHSALHGAWDKLAGGERFVSRTFHWDAPIDDASWRYAHNVRHHGMTNIAASDPDITLDRCGSPCRHRTRPGIASRFLLRLRRCFRIFSSSSARTWRV